MILIAEDDPAQVSVLEYNLKAEGFRTRTALDGQLALTLIEEEKPDLLLLDWMLPEVSGIEICRRLRREKATRHLPIIMLTAKGDETDKVRGLDTGANDYVVKPYSPKELIARIRAALRSASNATQDNQLTYREITMDLSTMRVWRDGKPIRLGRKGFRLLQLLMENPARVLSRRQIVDKVWGIDVYVEDRTVDVYIRRLRAALNENGKPDYIRTVFGFGYSLDAEYANGK